MKLKDFVKVSFLFAIIIFYASVFSFADNWEHYTANSSWLAGDKVRGLTLDDDNNLWIALKDERLQKFDGEDGTTFGWPFTAWPSGVCFSKGYIFDLSTNYIIKYNLSTSEQQNISYNLGTDVDLGDIKKVIIDNKGVYWAVGTKGVAKLSDSNWEELFDDYSNDIIEDDNGNIWVATYTNGIKKYDGTNWTDYTTENSPLASNSIRAIKSVDNYLLFATGHDILKVGLNKEEMYLIEVDGSWNGRSIYSIDAISLDTIVIGTMDGLAVTTDGGVIWTRYNSSNSVLPADIIYNVVIQDGYKVWVNPNSSSDSYGLYLYYLYLPNYPPSKPYDPNPEDGATDVPVFTNLIWQCDDQNNDSLHYTIKFDISNPPESILVSDFDKNSYTLPKLKSNTKYYWQIIAYDGKDSIAGDIWSFTTEEVIQVPPNKPEIWVDKKNILKNDKFTLFFSTTDDNLDSVFYKIDWGNGEVSDWIGPYNSGDTVTIENFYKNIGNYSIKILAKDEFDNQSSWSDSIVVSVFNDSSIVILSPCEGVKWEANTLHEIKWISVNLDGFFYVYISADNGNTYTKIYSKHLRESNVFDTLSILWTASEDFSSDKCIIKIEQADGISSQSDIFTIFKQGFEIISPKPEEFVDRNSIYKIKWNTNGTIYYVNLYYKASLNDEWVKIADHYYNTGEFEWHVPDSLTDDAYLKIRNADNAKVFYEMKNHFYITEPQAYKILNLSNNDTLYAEELDTIYWQSTVDTSNYIDIFFSKDSGQTFEQIEDSIGNKNFYVFKVPAVNTNKALLKIINCNNKLYYGNSGVFTIASHGSIDLLDTELVFDSLYILDTLAKISQVVNNTSFDFYIDTLYVKYFSNVFLVNADNDILYSKDTLNINVKYIPIDTNLIKDTLLIIGNNFEDTLQILINARANYNPDLKLKSSPDIVDVTNKNAVINIKSTYPAFMKFYYAEDDTINWNQIVFDKNRQDDFMINLDNLKSNTEYFFKVQFLASTEFSYPCSDIFSFHTLVDRSDSLLSLSNIPAITYNRNGKILANYNTNNLERGVFKIFFSTGDSLVFYDSEKTNNHTFMINNLLVDSLYRYTVGKIENNKIIFDKRAFEFRASSLKDITIPYIISGPNVDAANDKVIISFRATEPVKTTLYLMDKTGIVDTFKTEIFNTFNYFIIDDLEPNKFYSFSIEIEDERGFSNIITNESEVLFKKNSIFNNGDYQPSMKFISKSSDDKLFFIKKPLVKIIEDSVIYIDFALNKYVKPEIAIYDNNGNLFSYKKFGKYFLNFKKIFTGFKKDIEYKAIIKVFDINDNIVADTIFFTMKKDYLSTQATIDNLKKVIKNNILFISYQSNVPSFSEIEYSKFDDFHLSYNVMSGDFGSEHYFSIPDLNSSDSYYYRIILKDYNNNVIYSSSIDSVIIEDSNIALNYVNGITVPVIRNNLIKLSWQINYPTSARIEYKIKDDTTNDYVIIHSNESRTHNIVVKDLLPGKDYEFKITNVYLSNEIDTILYVKTLDSLEVDTIAPILDSFYIVEPFDQNKVEVKWHLPQCEDFEGFKLYKVKDGELSIINSNYTDTVFIEDNIDFELKVVAFDYSGNISDTLLIVHKMTIDIDESNNILSTTPVLKQNYPNPFIKFTKIEFSVPESQNVGLYVFNILGKEVYKYNLNVVGNKRYSVTIDAKNLSSGIYFYMLKTEKNGTLKRKMIILK